MSDTPTQPLKPKSVAGNVVAPNPVESQRGTLWSNGVVTLYGSERTDTISATNNDDLIVSRGATASGDVETIDGKKGHDIAVLPGHRGNYMARLPSAAEYPAITAPDWEKPETNTLYGRHVIMENVETQQVYQLSNVESVVFDNGKPFESPKAALVTLPDRIKDGSVTLDSTQNLFLQAQGDLDSGEIYLAQIAATREAADAVAKGYKFGMGEEALVEMADKAVADLADAQIKVSDRVAPQPDTPTSEYVQQQVLGAAPKMK